MKVLLVNPPYLQPVQGGNLPRALEEKPFVFPPLGLLYVAAAAQRMPDVTVSVIDAAAESLDQHQLQSRIQEMEPAVLGIQAMTFTLLDALDTARIAKERNPDIHIVFGGPHPSLYPQETAQLPPVDSVVVGEGEYVFPDILRALSKGSPLEGITGVVTLANSDQSIKGPQHIADLDTLGLPARELLSINLYHNPLARSNPVTTMMSSRGCPGRCIFCDRPHMGKCFRKRSAKSVVDEMASCKEELGVGEVVFYDDTFTIDCQRVIDICSLLMDRNLNMPWDIRARVDTIRPEMLNTMRKAGCHRIHYGVETGSQRLQKRLKKNIDLTRARDVFAATRRAGIEALGYFMVGIPDEAESDLRQTMDLLTSLPMDYAHIGIFTPFPGTEIYREALASGFYAEDYWRDFAKNPTKDFSPRHWNQNFSEEELASILRRAYRKFYQRPSYLLRQLSRVRSCSQLWQKAKLGFRLLFPDA